jgi:hypothetical protein
MRASPPCSSESPIGDGMTDPVIDNPARGRYELAREQDLRVRPRCSYVVQFMERNRQYQDLLQQP